MTDGVESFKVVFWFWYVIPSLSFLKEAKICQNYCWSSRYSCRTVNQNIFAAFCANIINCFAYFEDFDWVLHLINFDIINRDVDHFDIFIKEHSIKRPALWTTKVSACFLFFRLETNHYMNVFERFDVLLEFRMRAHIDFPFWVCLTGV